MFKLRNLFLLSLINIFVYSTNETWITVWDRPEYKEWALPIEGGYLLNIIRTEKDNNYLVVRAKLILTDKGLPSFEVIEQLNFSNKAKAIKQIAKWSNNRIISKL